MKKILVLIALVVTPMVTSAQSFFDSLEDMDGVDMVVVTKDAFELISKFKNVHTENISYLCIYCNADMFKMGLYFKRLPTATTLGFIWVIKNKC